VLAIVFGGAALALWLTGQHVSEGLVAMAALTVGNYLGYTGAVPVPARLEAVSAPYIPEATSR
jgi:hypothetical protein